MSQDGAIFIGTVDADGKVHLDFPKQQRAYCKARFAGQAVDVIVAPQGHRKSRLQECGLHAMLTPWAQSEGHRIDDLKRDILRAVFGTIEHVNPITGEIEHVLAEPSTAKLNRAKYSELIERTLEIGAECGIVLEAPHEYRERKEQERKRKAKADVSKA